MKLHLYNTLSRKIEEFYTLNNDNSVKMYSCGPTVYSYPHIGNMRAYVFADLLKRTLIINDYNVFNAINITDVGHLTSDADDGDDKMEKEARKTGKSAYDIADFFTSEFLKDYQKLNLLQPNVYPKATDHIQEQIDMIQKLEDKNYTYITSDGVYFDTAKFEKYTQFAKLDIEGMNSGNRIKINEEKRNKTDFALWKFSKKDENRQMEWNSPWGIGFPGWHAECSAMIMKHLGEQIDIHTGGIDHIPVHHTNEIAQTESVTNKKFSNFWLHVNFLQLKNLEDENGEPIKMSKSLGNILTISGLEEKGYSPMVVKYFYLNSHYRSELQFNFDLLDSAKNTFIRLQNKIKNIKENTTNSQDSEILVKIKNEINQDLNTPKVLALFQESLNSDDSFESKLGVVEFIEKITGFNFDIIENTIPVDILDLANERSLARKNNNWNESDRLRDLILEKGYLIKDNKDNFELKLK
jgi:cysteinyl-tRNA synthetase